MRETRDEILDGLDRRPWDTVYLSLHGAMIGQREAGKPETAERETGADLDLVAAVRARIGATPLAVSFDPHANLDPPLARLTPGRFVNRGPMERGLAVDLGPGTVLAVGGIETIVTSACVLPNDPESFALHGIELARFGQLCAKAKNHFRATFGETFAVILDVDTPGPAALDPAKLPFRRVPPERLPPAKT